MTAANDRNGQDLALVFDELVESRRQATTFADGASLVATFTRLYVQNLFDLNENEFRNIARKNRELHLRAENYERSGKNPMVLLEKQMAKKDNLGKILSRYANHLGALDCILDLRATAALIHHLIDLKVQDHLPDKVVACEFGAGLGILSLAGIVPVLASGRSVVIHTFEQASQSRNDAEQIARLLQKGCGCGHRFDLHVHEGDITTGEPYKIVADEVVRSGPLALWISETFGYQTRKPVVSEEYKRCRWVDPEGVVPYPPDLEKIYDPLPHVVKNSSTAFEGFFKKMKSGEIGAFPNFVTPKVIIDGENSAILSPDGNWRSLQDIGEPYTMLPKCVATRWRLIREDSTQRKKEVSRKKKMQKKKFHCR